ncbi:hypothetical protein DE146DRAFT_217595 [Phaeosphaeria sp. MPI-PUGE-AT-0046c]|nr:hypothetical protein DE146DRAFT_217595 [Phaeosphaeria sp. MPI-PUGE-AT-0046c]
MSMLHCRNGVGGFKQPTPHMTDRVTGFVVGEERNLSTLYKTYEQFQEHDLQKDKFINELLIRVEDLTQQIETLNTKVQHNEEVVATWRDQKARYDGYVLALSRALHDNPFIMVLIDGDGMIFNGEYIQEGETGGRRAASQLHAEVQNYMQSQCEDVPLGARIVCRVYANVRGLGDVLVRNGTIEELSIFEDFVRGFSRGKTLFDFVDVGAGKDRADEKIIESLKLFSQDYHCRRILFGCSHYNGYARSLEECSDRPEIVGKVVLLEGVPFEKELLALPYKAIKFPRLFRDSKIVLPGAPGAYTPLAQSSPARNYTMLPGLPTRFPPPARPAVVIDSPLPTQAALAASNIPRTPSSSTLASDQNTTVKPATTPGTWAAKAAAAPPPPAHRATSPEYKPMNRDEVVSRNRNGQRVDPPTKDYDKAEVDRVKKMKLCNTHFLRKECPYGDQCSHDHSARPTEDELKTLRLVARMAPCVNGSGCSDNRCIYGHRCPAPPHRTRHVKGTKSCIFEDQCKFPVELHDIDTTVVKTVVIK